MFLRRQPGDESMNNQVFERQDLSKIPEHRA